MKIYNLGAELVEFTVRKLQLFFQGKFSLRAFFNEIFQIDFPALRNLIKTTIAIFRAYQ